MASQNSHIQRQRPHYCDVGTLENTYLRKAGLRLRYYMFVEIVRIIPLQIKLNPRFMQ
jgi:hypothetical protein